MLTNMTKCLQVLLPDEELAEIQEHARRRRQTTAAWVRDALRQAREAAAYPDAGRKLRAIRDAVAHTYPTADIDEMLAQIESGYGATRRS
jgi:aminopeptidase N